MPYIEGFSVPLFFDTLLVCKGGLICRHPFRAMHSHGFHGFFNPDWTDDIYSNTALDFKRGGAHKAADILE